MDQAGDAEQAASSAKLRKEWKTKFPNILILGTNESGKKTLAKQAQVVGGEGFTNEEVAKYRDMIRAQLLSSARAIASYIHTGGIQCLDTTKRAIKTLLKEDGQTLDGTSVSTLCREKAKAIAHLWKDPVCVQIVQNRHQLARLGIMNFAPSFFSSALRIGAADYVPSTAEIVRLKGVATDSSIVEAHLHNGKPPIRLLTLKDRRLLEGKKWIDYFDDVSGIIFCTDISDYNRFPEAGKKNPIDESIAAFYSVITLPAFRYTPVVLFLNKMDSFRRKVSHDPLNRYFPEYKGGSDPTQALQFIQTRFLAPLRANPKMGPLVECLVLTAINTDNCRDVLQQAQMELIEMRLDGCTIC